MEVMLDVISSMARTTIALEERVALKAFANPTSLNGGEECKMLLNEPSMRSILVEDMT